MCSASGADKEEQGQGEEAEEEGACRVECIPVDALRTLISRFDKSVIIIRGHALYQIIVPMPMNIHTYTCQAMSVAMLTRRKHDVRLRDKRVCMLPCIPILPLFQAQIRKISGSIFAGCDSGGMHWSHFAAYDIRHAVHGALEIRPMSAKA